MYGRIVKSEHILTKLRVLDYEYICDRTAKFHKKILFITRVINIQILTTKYFSFQYSDMQSGTQASRSDVDVLTQWTQTSDLITQSINMVFSVEDRILIKVLRKEKGYGAKWRVREFPGKPWTLSGLSYLLKKIDNDPAHRARETVHLLSHETPDFITLALWPANSPDLNPVDYQILGKL